MVRMLWLAVAVSCSGLACGGSLQKDDSASNDGGAKNLLSAPAPSGLPPETPYGVWDLISLDGMAGGNGSTQTLDQLVLELRADGNAIARRCTRPSYDPVAGTFRCGASDAYACFYGTVSKESDTWRVDIPDLHLPVIPARGVILPDANDTIVIRYVLPKYAAGHFVRVTNVSPTSACASP